MNALNSPVEALALNCLTYGFFSAVNKMLAAWLSAVTAAFSFWRIGASPPLRSEHRGRSKDAASTSCTPLLEVAAKEAGEPAGVSTNRVSSPATTSCRALERENSTKGKFVLYYREDEFREDGMESVDCEDRDDDVAAVSEKFRQWCDVDWEQKMAIRMGDMGWYRYQELTAFKGNVVRLWDGCRAAA